ncbi:zf-RVT domain-containing protein, partial [Cephalotus follicularis]
IGRNSSWSLWYDPWFQSSSLVSKLGSRIIYESGLHRDAPLSEVIQDSVWSWPNHVWQLREISLACSNIPIRQSDAIGWVSEGRAFSFKSAWETIRSPAPLAPWLQLVWFRGAIPKHSFCLWLTFHKAHRTLDKLLAFGFVQHSHCPFDCGHQESINHLFFECAFTRDVWSKVLERNDCPFPSSWNWDNLVDWAMRHATCNSFSRWMRRTGLAAAVYHCWKERNNRIFRHSTSSSAQLLSRISLD